VAAGDATSCLYSGDTPNKTDVFSYLALHRTIATEIVVGLPRGALATVVINS
jgi:hypothetical protein